MIYRIAAASLLSSVGMLAGCQGVHPPLEGRADVVSLPPQITFATPDVRNAIAVGTPVVQRDDAGNLLHVTVPIRTDRPKTIYIDYRATFIDAAGATVWQSGWMPKTLEANTPDSIAINSTTDRAADFTLAIRKAR